MSREEHVNESSFPHKFQGDGCFQGKVGFWNYWDVVLGRENWMSFWRSWWQLCFRLLVYWTCNWVSCCCRSQTTKGIWIAKCVGIEPSTIAMDLEGTDGRERGEVIYTGLEVFFIFCYFLSPSEIRLLLFVLFFTQVIFVYV